MGVSGEEFMDVRMESEHYHKLSNEIKEGIEIRNVFEEGWDSELKKHDSYNRLKKASTKAYKELKELEFIITNKK